MEWVRTPWAISSGVHVGVALAIALMIFNPGWDTADFLEEDVVEITQVPIEIKTAAPPKVAPEEKPKAVFGANRNSITDSGETKETAQIKAGNTLAKEEDDETLEDDDPSSLPIPTDEYLVTAMPLLVSEFKIPYPADAKSRGIEGPVEMELLLDQEGSVRKVSVLSAPDAALEAAAKEAILKFKFKPAKIKDQTVAVKIRYVYRFVLER